MKNQMNLFKTLTEIELDDQLAALESILFAVGEEGVSAEQLEYVLERSDQEIFQLIKEAKTRYERPSSGLVLSEIGARYKLTTKKDHAPYLRRLVQDTNQRGLSNAALEVLTIIAYKQPITRHEIEHIRGASSEKVLKRLLTFALIEEAGRLEAPGRPMLYKTAEGFLDHFGIKALDELPDLAKIEEALAQKEEEADLFISNQTEEQKRTEQINTVI